MNQPSRSARQRGVSLIDALINTICILAGANDLEEGHWVRQYVCIGISGWITKIIKCRSTRVFLTCNLNTHFFNFWKEVIVFISTSL